MDEAEVPGGTERGQEYADKMFEPHRLSGEDQEKIAGLLERDDDIDSILPEPKLADPLVDEAGAAGEDDDAEPPPEVGMMVRTERGGVEVPFLIMVVHEEDAVSGLVFQMTGPAFVRPIEKLLRTPPGNGGWWFDWEGRV